MEKGALEKILTSIAKTHNCIAISIIPARLCFLKIMKMLKHCAKLQMLPFANPAFS